jgi:hypothetical protein
VPYAIAALLGWGLVDVVAQKVHRLIRRLRGPADRDGRATALALSERPEI